MAMRDALRARPERTAQAVLLTQIVVSLCVLGTRPVEAQPRPGAVYVTGGVIRPHQNGITGETAVVYDTAPGGTTVGWIAGGGVFVSHLVSLELDVASTGVMHAREPSRYGQVYLEERRDRFLTLAVRFHLPRLRVFALEPLVGVSVVRRERWSQTEYWPTSRPSEPPRIGPKEHARLPTLLGVTIGIDARVGGRRLAFVPSFRATYVPGSYCLGWYSGVGPALWTLQPGALLRFSF